MKKLSIVFIIAGFMAMFTVQAIAGGHGSLSIEVNAGSYEIDGDSARIPNGGAFGISGAVGKAKGKTTGYAENGTVTGNLIINGGGTTTTSAYRFHPGIGDRSIGVGSASDGYAHTSGDLYVDTIPGGFASSGSAGGHIAGSAAQGTFNASRIGESPIFFSTDGESKGFAAQGSVGNFIGAAHTGHSCCFNGKPGFASASIDMNGGSYSESYRFVDYNHGSITEGMGTNVGAYTEVNTAGHSSRHNGFVAGGFVAGGAVGAKTVQADNFGGGAVAKANGVYYGDGSLNNNYTGSANGGTMTTVTTFRGYNGAINSASADMTVTSVSH